MSRVRPPSSPAALAALALLLVAAAAVPVAASPAPVSACAPCDEGFTSAAASADLDTEVAESEATVRVHTNDTATWTARVVPTNEAVLDRLAENATLADSVARDSFGVRYGGDLEQELVGADVRDGAFVIRYRTTGVVESGPFGTTLFTCFRDSPGQYVYTALGADELTVVAPQGTTVASGFGEVDGPRMTATALPDATDGPFVVFAPEGSAAPGLVGTLAVLDALSGVISRNLLLFVALPVGVAVGGLAGVRRAVSTRIDRDPARSGTVVAAGGVVLLVGTLATEADALPTVTGNLLVGAVVGAVLLGLGAAVASPVVRERLTTRLLVAVGVAVALLVVAGGRALGGRFHTLLTLGAALFPLAVALGRADAIGSGGRRLLAGIAVVLTVGLLAVAPVASLGGTLFLLGPILLTVATAAFVAIAVSLYVLGAASVAADGDGTDPRSPTTAV